MLSRVIAFSLQRRTLVVGCAALVMAYGLFAIARLPVDVFPDLNRPTVTVLTEAPGMTPESVEKLVTFPLESDLNGAPGVERVRSVSSVGLSVVHAEFGWSVEASAARQVVSERLQLSRERLPEGITPVMAPMASLMGEILLVGLQSDEGGASPMQLRTLADWTVRQRLLAIPGVAQVTPIGGEVEQVQVLVEPAKLRAAGVALSDVERATAEAQGATTGGFVETRGQEWLVASSARTSDPEAIGATAVSAGDGAPVRLRDLGRVVRGARVKRGDAGMNARPAVILAVSKQPGANTLDLTGTVERELAGLRATLPPGVRLEVLFRQATFIDAAVRNVLHALRDGALLVAIVLLVFLASFRTTAITLTAIPLSLVTSAIVFHAFGLSINTMTLGGLSIAIGELVDDAIVDVENVSRRLAENRGLARPRAPLRVIFDACAEVRGSIVFATLMVVLVFVPLFALTGVEGRFFAPLGIAYIVSITASLLVSLTVTPALCAMLLPRAPSVAAGRHGSRLVRWLQDADRRLLGWTLPRANGILVAAALLVALALATLPLFGRAFLPPFNEGTATVNVVCPPSTSLSESSRIGTIAEEILLAVPEVRATGRRTGRAELDEHAEGVGYSEIDVDFREGGRDRDEVLADMRDRLSQVPGVLVSVGQPIGHRLDHVLSGVRAQVAVKVFGAELDVLRAKAEEIRAVMAAVPGVVDLGVESQALVPQVSVNVRREDAARLGLAPGALARSLETALAGRTVAHVLEDQRVVELVVRLDQQFRSSPEILRVLPVDLPGGGTVPLGEVADVVETSAPNQVSHENGQRRIVVACNVAGRDLVGTVEDIRRGVESQVALPAGVFVQYGGQFESEARASRLIGLLCLVSLAVAVVVLHAHFRSLTLVLQVLLNIPLALVGAVAAVALTGGVLSIASLVGFVTLTGIASRNTIMMLSHYEHLVRHEGEKLDQAMVVRGSVERLVPVLMTALTAGLSLLPLVFAGSQPGKEVLHPVACVILGGLVSSTLLDIVVTPAAFWRFGRKALASTIAAVPEDALLADTPLPGRYPA